MDDDADEVDNTETAEEEEEDEEDVMTPTVELELCDARKLRELQLTWEDGGGEDAASEADEKLNGESPCDGEVAKGTDALGEGRVEPAALVFASAITARLIFASACAASLAVGLVFGSCAHMRLMSSASGGCMSAGSSMRSPAFTFTRISSSDDSA
jgi:hypothetical protein